MAEIDALLQEHRRFAPSDEFRRGRDRFRPVDLRTRRARLRRPSGPSRPDQLHWFTRWKTVCEWKPPHAKWFVGGKLNVSDNCIDRHVHGPRRNKAALIWEGEPGDRRTLTYWDLYVEVQKFANVLKTARALGGAIAWRSTCR